MNNFSALGLSDAILKRVESLGFITPTPIQEKAIPILLAGNQDFVGLAQTGTGKTAAFGLPLIQLLNEKEHHTQTVVLSPTRELCLQITSDLQSFLDGLKGLQIVPVYGGASLSEQIKLTKKGPHIIVA